MTNQPGSVPINFIDNPHAPEVYADEVTGIAWFNGNIRLTFESARVDHSTSPGPVNRVVIARLVMPLDGAERLRDLITDYIGKMKASQSAPAPQSPPRTLN